MGKGGGSSNSKAIRKQYEYDVNQWQFNWQEMQDKYEYQKDAYEVQIWNQNQSLDYRDQISQEEYNHKMAMRDFDYENQIQAYNASVESYEAQLNHNNLAYEISANDNKRKYNERLTSIGFQNEELVQQMAHKVGGMDLALSQQKEGIEQDLKHKTAGWDLALGQRKEGLEQDLAHKTASWDLALEQQTESIVQDVEHKDQSLTQASKQFAEDKMMQVGFAKSKYNQRRAEVAQDVGDTIQRAALEGRGLSIAHRANMTKLGQKARDLGLKQMQATGQISAMGQTGRSARKNMQSALSQFGTQQAVLADFINSEESKYGLDFDRLSQTLDSKAGVANLQLKSIATEFANQEQAAEQGISHMRSSTLLKKVQIK